MLGCSFVYSIFVEKDSGSVTISKSMAAQMHAQRHMMFNIPNVEVTFVFDI